MEWIIWAAAGVVAVAAVAPAALAVWARMCLRSARAGMDTNTEDAWLRRGAQTRSAGRGALACGGVGALIAAPALIMPHLLAAAGKAPTGVAAFAAFAAFAGTAGRFMATGLICVAILLAATAAWTAAVRYTAVRWALSRPNE